MDMKWFSSYLSLTILLFLLTSSSWAGQVITEEERLWARNVLAEEEALEVTKGRNTLAVLYFQNKTGQVELDPLQKGLALMLITDLSTVRGIQIVERIRLQALAEEIGLGVSGLVEPDTAPRIGKLMGAEWLIGGDISIYKPFLRDQTEDKAPLQLNSRLLDVPTSEILGQPIAEGALSDLFEIEKAILFDIIELLKIELTPKERERLMRPCSTNRSALNALFRGVDASDRGNYEEAANLYQMALKADSGICVARDAFKEFKLLHLIKVKKRSPEILRSLRDETSLTNDLTHKDADKRIVTPEEVKTRINIGIEFPK